MISINITSVASNKFKYRKKITFRVSVEKFGGLKFEVVTSLQEKTDSHGGA